MAVVDMLLIIACVLEYSILNVFVGNPPRWYLRAYPYFFHPLKVSTVKLKDWNSKLWNVRKTQKFDLEFEKKNIYVLETFS